MPKTLLLDELEPGERYEIVTTKFRGGAFVRYRVGDVIECISLGSEINNISLPQIRFVDRISNVIDLAGFTRITKTTIDKALETEEVPINNWVACKEYEDNEPILHLYIEAKGIEVNSEELKNTINEKLQGFDSDYKDLHTMLGMDPLRVTILSKGAFEQYDQISKDALLKMNPNKRSIELLKQLGTDD
jgi:phenylacetate-coenzyme A ligase PaaK-like adenylate-forming protein